MRATCFVGISLLLSPTFVAGSAASPGPETTKPRGEMMLWYRQPGEKWLEGLPLGNGIMGAMVFGGVREERIALNEGTFWSGRPHDYNKPGAHQYFGQIRDLVFAEKFQEAENLEVSMQWKAGKLVSAQIRGITPGPCRVRSGGKTVTFPLQAGEALKLNADLVSGDDARGQQ